MNHGANAAFVDMTRRGICTAGSVMVPCPWFPEVAELQARDPRLDIGVHLVLTSEFKAYRWRPLTGTSQASGLVDPDGYFWPTAREAREHAHPDAVEAELRAQIDAAKKAGIDITHIDSHMFTVLCPQFIEIYTQLGREERVPVLLVRQDAAYGSMEKGPAVDAAVRAADGEGLPGVRSRPGDAVASRRLGGERLRCAPRPDRPRPQLSGAAFQRARGDRLDRARSRRHPDGGIRAFLLARGYASGSRPTASS